ncbi:MAG: NAD(P)-dependent alcohol dehydrogenase [Treponemataceae bacterium]
MKALISEKYGPPESLRIGEAEKPIPKQGQVLIRVRAASVNSADWRILVADPFLVRLMGGGLFKPAQRIPGSDVAGTVEALGPGCGRFKIGDAVLGDLFNCGRSSFAEYVCADENALALKPDCLTFEEAAAVPLAGVTAWHALHGPVAVGPGMKVLINGASGGVGAFALQIAKAIGAEVTAVCSAGNMEQSRALGADRVIDYRVKDFSADGPRYDLILGVNGNRSLSAYKRALRPGGTYLMVGGGGKQLFQAMLLAPLYSLTGGKKMSLVSSVPDPKALEDLLGMCAAGKVKPVIDKVFSLDQAVEAFRYLGAGHARGKVVIKIGTPT